MPWKQTLNGHPYFQLNVRRGKQVRSEYFHDPYAAQRVADAVEQRRTARVIQRRRLQELLAFADDVERCLEHWNDGNTASQTQGGSNMTAANFPDSFDWDAVSDFAPQGPVDQLPLEELLSAVHGGQREAILELQRRMDQDPEIWQVRGHLARGTQRRILERLQLEAGLTQVITERFVDELRQRLLGSSPSIRHQLAVERYVTAWLHVQWVTTQMYAQDGLTASSSSAAMQKHLTDRLDKAQRYYDVADRRLEEFLPNREAGDVTAPPQRAK